jgi:CheY-like chemotaxis protein
MYANIKILIAEDSPINQKIISHLLKKMEIPHAVVENGAKAIEAAANDRYDFILMDIYMPELSGIDAAKAIRTRLPRDKQPVIIALTANAESEDRDACLASGMQDFITKPLSESTLASILTKWQRE